MNIYYDKILGRLREAGLTDNSATEIALILSELVESNEATELNTKNVVTALNKFGSLSALTNGVGFYWDTQEEPLYELHEGIKTNKEFIRIASDTGAIGTGIDAYLADVSGGGTEKSYLPNIDMDEIYGLPYGLRLRKGTLDKLIFRVNDDLTGLTTFNAIATGTRI